MSALVNSLEVSFSYDNGGHLLISNYLSLYIEFLDRFYHNDIYIGCARHTKVVFYMHDNCAHLTALTSHIES